MVKGKLPECKLHLIITFVGKKADYSSCFYELSHLFKINSVGSAISR